MMTVSSAINFKKWIHEHRDLLKPPVGNQVVWKNTDFIIMVVGGPNARKDYHFNEGEEFFYQLKGNIVLKTIQDGRPLDVRIKEGDIFLLPPRTPHSPQRPAKTIGLVVERKRRAHELDGFQWYCEKCHSKLYEEFIPLTDIVTQLPLVFDRFYGNPEHCTCKACGAVMKRPVLKTDGSTRKKARTSAAKKSKRTKTVRSKTRRR